MSDAVLTVVASGAALGAEVRNLDLRAVDEARARAVRQAWLDHQVLLFRDQHLNDAALVAFSRWFGDLDLAPVQETGRRSVDGHPEIYVVSNVLENGVPIGSLGAGEALWHTDMSYLVDPPQASILYAMEVPASGGDTVFCSMYAAWDALPEGLGQQIREARVKHDGTYNSGGFVRQGVVPSNDPRDSPGTLHPMVMTHPETGRRCLYLGRRRNAYVDGLPLEKSEALLDAVWSYATRDEQTWRHQWRVGDVVLWDNRCTMHRRDSFDPTARRVMHRTQIRSTPDIARPANRPIEENRIDRPR